MNLTINGDPHATSAATLPDLLCELGADPVRVAVVLNDRIIPAAARADARLVGGDRIELISFAAGG